MIEFIHELAAAVWVGGLITLGALVPALRRAGVDRAQLQAAARQFGRLSWTAMAALVITGLMRYIPGRVSYDGNNVFLLKLGLVVVAVILAASHQFTARQTTPRTRGIIQGLIMLASLGAFAAATTL